MDKFDLCVLGCGPGGFAAAMRALDYGKDVCIVEANNIGGAGIFNGAMTSKTMWELARDYSIAAKVDRGYRSSGLSVDYNAVRDTVINAAKEKQFQLLSQIQSFGKSKNEKGSLTLIRGRGRFKTRHILEITRKEEIYDIEADNFIIATGSTPRAYKGIPFDEERILSSDGVLGLRTFPKRMMIIGAGIIGCEYTTIFSYFRQTKVHLLDRQDRIIPFEDEDLSDLVSKNLMELGVSIYHNAILREINKYEDGLEVVVDYEDGHSKVIEVDVALISIGRMPNTAHLNLNEIGINVRDGGYLRVNEHGCLDDNIYAVGDVTGRSALYSVAEMEGRFTVEAMYSDTHRTLNYTNMSTIMFFRPEVSAVGLNEQRCRAKKIPYKVGRVRLNMVNRAIAMRNVNGFVKIIVSLDERPKIIGMRAAGPRAADLIMMIAMSMDQDRDLVDIMRTVHPHPSMSEALQICLRMLMNKSVYKPHVFPEYMKIETWRP